MEQHELYMDVPKSTTQHKQIMVMTATACCIKIIQIYYDYIYLLGFKHSISLLIPYSLIMLVSIAVPLFSRFLVILQQVRKFSKKLIYLIPWHTHVHVSEGSEREKCTLFVKLCKNIFYKTTFIVCLISYLKTRNHVQGTRRDQNGDIDNLLHFPMRISSANINLASCDIMKTVQGIHFSLIKHDQRTVNSTVERQCVHMPVCVNCETLELKKKFQEKLVTIQNFVLKLLAVQEIF